MTIYHQAPKYGRELSLPEAGVVENEPATSYARRVKLKAKHEALGQLKSKWEATAWSVPEKNKRDGRKPRPKIQLAEYT